MLEWGPESRRQPKGGASLLSALGKLLAVGGSRAAPGRTAAARALASLAASGEQRWAEAAPRKGRLKRVVAMLKAGEGGGEDQQAIRATGSPADAEELGAAATALAAMISSPQVREMAFRAV